MYKKGELLWIQKGRIAMMTDDVFHADPLAFDRLVITGAISEPRAVHANKLARYVNAIATIVSVGAAVATILYGIGVPG